MAERETADLLIRNAYVLTMDDERQIYRQGAIAVRDGVLAGVGPEDEILKLFTSEKQIDAHGGIVHPGFIESHVHITQHLFRHAFTGETTWDGVSTFFYDGWVPIITPEQEFASSRLACVEMLRNGTTAFLEGGTVIDRDAAAAAVADVGMRGSLGDQWLFDSGIVTTRGDSATTTDEAISGLGSQLGRNSDPEALVQGHVSVLGNGWASDELELAAKACADENGVVFNQHQAYNEEIVREEDANCGGVHALKHFAELGIIDHNSTFAHMNVIRDDEFAALCEMKPSIGWCPTASMLYGVGGTFHGRHLELYKAGVSVGLGSDAPNWSGPLDVGEQGFIAMLTSREKAGGGGGLIAEDVLTMATVNGARALGWDDRVGSLEAGKCADVVIRRADIPEALPLLDPVRSLVSSSRAKSVDTVLVKGETVVESGHCVRVDEESVYGEARSASAAMLEEMGYSASSRWPVVD